MKTRENNERERRTAKTTKVFKRNSCQVATASTALFMSRSYFQVKTLVLRERAGEGGTAADHLSPVQSVLQQLHVLAGVHFQAAFCKERKGEEGVGEGRQLVTRTSAFIRLTAVSEQQITALIPLKQTHH